MAVNPAKRLSTASASQHALGVLNGLETALIACDRKGLILVWNPAAETLFEAAREMEAIWPLRTRRLVDRAPLVPARPGAGSLRRDRSGAAAAQEGTVSSAGEGAP